MERLTEWRNGHAAIVNHRENYIDKLARYEDAEEQGRLIVLPCKIGDTVYINTPSGATLTEVVDSVTKPQFRTKTVEGLRGLDFEFCDYGKTVFLSSEEAEKALEGIKCLK